MPTRHANATANYGPGGWTTGSHYGQPGGRGDLHSSANINLASFDYTYSQRFKRRRASGETIRIAAAYDH